MACRGCWLPNVLSAPSSAPAGAQTSLSQGDLKTSGCPRAALSLSCSPPAFGQSGRSAVLTLLFLLSPLTRCSPSFSLLPLGLSVVRSCVHVFSGCHGHFPGVSGPGVHRSFPGGLERSCPPEGREGGWGEASPCHSVDKLRVNKGPGMGTGV